MTWTALWTHKNRFSLVPNGLTRSTRTSLNIRGQTLEDRAGIYETAQAHCKDTYVEPIHRICQRLVCRTVHSLCECGDAIFIDHGAHLVLQFPREMLYCIDNKGKDANT